MQATIYRALYLNEVSDLDTAAVGCHWSFDECIEEVVERQLLSLREQRTGDTLMLFRAVVDADQINWGATVQSNRDYANENECVLNFGASIAVEYRDEAYEFQPLGVANVGEAGHAWVREAQEATEKEINDLVANLQEWASIEA